MRLHEQGPLVQAYVTAWVLTVTFGANTVLAAVFTLTTFGVHRLPFTALSAAATIGFATISLSLHRALSDGTPRH